MKIAIASDHAAYDLKEYLLDWLKSQNYEVFDFGTFSVESCDYPDFAYPAAEAVSKGEANFGIIVCGSGIGMSIVCNKVKGIRAANCLTPEMAELARLHNNANILNMGSRLIDFDTAKAITVTFLNTKFEGGRHSLRVEKIHSKTGC
ncbi:ribose 5-phosphate isomerase B [Bacteroidota bacterium]